MVEMFFRAHSFNGDLSKWDVSRVSNMDRIFKNARSFAQTLCGAWFTSKAGKLEMFDKSTGRLCSATTDAPGKSTAMSTHAAAATVGDGGDTDDMLSTPAIVGVAVAGAVVLLAVGVGVAVAVCRKDDKEKQ